MPGDNVELVLSLVHDVAADVGTRYVLFYGGMRTCPDKLFQFHTP